MKILAIETSCDETAIALVRARGDMPDITFEVLSNVVLSQVKLHARYGGVYPSLAKREHAKNLIPTLTHALRESCLFKKQHTSGRSRYGNDFLRTRREAHSDAFGKEIKKQFTQTLEREPELLEQFWDVIPTIEKPPVDAIAVTFGPGLEPALWVGINFAKALSTVWHMPVIPVNHMHGHLFSALLEKKVPRSPSSQKKTIYALGDIVFPAMGLLISGGHTELVLIKDWHTYEIVGETRDDAVGEAFDKAARMLGLPYPGGPHIERAAKSASSSSAEGTSLPRPMINSGDLDFSFSGLKTALLYKIKKETKKLPKEIIQVFAYEFQEAVADVLSTKTCAAAREYSAKTILVGGGVSANTRVREKLTEDAKNKLRDTNVVCAPKELTGDNACMIAVAGYIASKKHPPLAPEEARALSAVGTLRIS